MAYQMEELIPVVAKLAEKYTGCDSSSVTYEKAQMLMAAVIYCLDECTNSSVCGLAGHDLSIQAQYEIGETLVLEKTDKLRKLYNRMVPDFWHYGVECLYDTVLKGIPEFLKWYDPKFCPQYTMLTLDYPLLIDISQLRGIDAVYEYTCAIDLEQKFLGKFDRNYVASILEKANGEFQVMIENICSMVLMNSVGHAAIGKPFREIGFQAEDYDKLTGVFGLQTVEEVELKVRQIVERIVMQIYQEDKELLQYLCCEVGNIAVRIELLIKNRQLDRIFVL